MENHFFYDVTEEPLIIPISVVDILLKEKDNSELTSIYIFSYATLKWEKKFPTISDISKKTKLSKKKIEKGLKKLQELGLMTLTD